MLLTLVVMFVAVVSFYIFWCCPLDHRRRPFCVFIRQSMATGEIAADGADGADDELRWAIGNH